LGETEFGFETRGEVPFPARMVGRMATYLGILVVLLFGGVAVYVVVVEWPAARRARDLRRIGDEMRLLAQATRSERGEAATLEAPSRDRALRDAVSAYAEARGGSVVFDLDGHAFTVEGPRGKGRQSMAEIQAMCGFQDPSKWESSIGFSLRRYIPDAIDDVFAAEDQERLSELGPVVAALTEDELRGRLRIHLYNDRSDAKGLATCAIQVGSSMQARVALDGVDLSGIPEADRVRLPESDEALFELALEQTLPNSAPGVDRGEADNVIWLCRPEALFGDAPHLIVASGERLVWTPVEPGDVEARLAALCGASAEQGAMRYQLFAWDGAVLTSETILSHSIRGPETPDYTLSAPPSFYDLLGIVPSTSGTFGVRR